MADRSSDQGSPVTDILGRLAEARGSGEAAGGLVRAEVDGTGDLVGLVIEPKAMRLASEDLAEAVREAIGLARTQVRESLAEMAPEPGRALGGDVGTTLARLGTEAQSRLGEMTALARELSDRLGRQS